MAETNRIKQFGNKDYQSLCNVREAYRRAGGHKDEYAENFNRFDNPNTVYFRIFFDFGKGLLDYLHDLGRTNKPDINTIFDRNTYIANSALNYLMLNNEWERADMLREFIHLLSNINTYSPWYFTELEGLGELINRTEFTTDNFQIPEVKPLNIKCLPDAYDNRIGTLLDLYRAICFSYQLHKEVVPANLRRFDMYVYIFPANIRGIHTLHKYIDDSNIESKEPDNDKFASFDQDLITVDTGETGKVTNSSGKYITSSKLIHLSGCEIDLNAVVSGYQNVKNDEGFIQEYTIPIKVRVAMEQRYNEHLMKRIGDFVVADLDLPNTDDNYPNGNPGNMRDVNWDADTASRAVTVTPTDNRLNKDLLRKGMVAPKKGDTEYYDEYTKQKSPDMLGTSRYRDQNKPSLIDPWLNMGAQKAGQIAGQVNQMINAGKSAIESWVDVGKLNQSIVTGTDNVINRLMWGNIFESGLQDFTTEVSSVLSSMSSDNTINQAIRGGWTHKERT